MPQHPNSLIAHPVERVGGAITVPGDKSISHRSLMLGAVAEGPTTVHGFLDGQDCVATRRALAALGVPIRTTPEGAVTIQGVGPSGLHAPSQALDLGNSGTGMRLLAGLLASQPFDVELTGDASLRSRPMERIAAPLRAMGARIETTNGRPPLTIRGGAKLHGIDYALPIASAQVKSALLLAALGATGRTVLRSPGLSRDHTERMLRTMGAAVSVTEDGLTVSLEGPVELHGAEIHVPGDFSSAAFFIVAGCLGAADGLVIRNVGVNSTRTGLLRVLSAMGADVELTGKRTLGSEPVADLVVRRSALKGIDVPPEWVPLAIDEFPVLFIAATAAEGMTTVRGAQELRAKETDRLGVMAEGLKALGVGVRETPEGLSVEGCGRLRGGRIDARGDHRVAMAFAVASLLADAPIEIDHTAEVATSFPSFLEVAGSAGLRLAASGS